MPNWCDNVIKIENITDEQIVRITKAADEGTLMAEFWPEPDYTVTPVAKTYPEIGASFADSEEEKEKLLKNEPTIREDGWWDWRVQHWGTKWEACEPSYTYDQDVQTLYVTFMSAWSPPSKEWIEKLAEVYPETTIYLSYSEPGMDFTGLTIYCKGETFDRSINISDIANEWMEKNLDPELLAKHKDKEHPDHDQASEDVWEAWNEVIYQELDKFQEGLIKEVSKQLSLA